MTVNVSMQDLLQPIALTKVISQMAAVQPSLLHLFGMEPGGRELAMMQMMELLVGGGYMGGTNAPILPAALEGVDDEEWRKIRSHFEETLLSGFEAQYPAEFRDLLTAYFTRLRKEMLK